MPSTKPHCLVCGETSVQELRRVALVRPALIPDLKSQCSAWEDNGWVCVDHIHDAQDVYVRRLLEQEKGELTELELTVLRGLRDHETTMKNPLLGAETNLTFGQRLADKVASFGGSWAFILSFTVFILAWMVLNAVLLARRAFDPFPFILLNLILSTLAALQAPVIMMSQGRQEARDRAQANYDYQVNLKAELEIRQLHQKVDHLISKQWERLIEIQEIQLEIMNEIRSSEKA